MIYLLRSGFALALALLRRPERVAGASA